MASEPALSTAFNTITDEEKIRKLSRHPLPDVPKNDLGLKILAANGEWSAVVELADKLEDVAASRAGSSLEVDGQTVQVPISTAARARRLPYVLVQASAYFKMGRVASVNQLLTQLGDLEGSGYQVPTTGEVFTPFSLRFIAAVLPQYLGSAGDAQRRLYALLSKCEQRVADLSAAPASAASTASVRLWHQRCQRCRRALIQMHFTANQYAAAIHVFETLIATDETLAAAAEPDGQAGVPGFATVKHILQLQQFACLCLHAGNSFLAQQAFHHISALAESDACGGDMQSVARQVVSMNEAFTMVFYGQFEEAAERFRAIAATARAEHARFVVATEGGGDPVAASVSVEPTLAAAVLQQVRTNAQTSFLTCMPYAYGVCPRNEETSNAAMALMPSIVSSLEEYLADNGDALVQSDAFLGDAVRIYTLAGDRRRKLEKLADLLEVFRSERSSIPPLEKMV